jgi:RNA polymerase sigma factor (sigma-70 family)
MTMTSLTMTPTEAPVPHALAGGAAGPDPLILAEAHQLAVRVARAELGQHAHEGIGAEDVAQEVLLRVSTLDLSEVGNWRAWVTTAARNRARDALRAERRHAHQALAGFGDEATPGEPGAPLPRQLRALGPSGSVLAAMAWARATQILGPREREALGASLDGWSNQDIAARMGYASAATVAVTLTRARAKLRAAFPAGPARDLLLGEIRLY